MNALAIVAASAAGWAILALAILMLYHMDLRSGRLMVAAGWVAAALSGGYFGLVPGLLSEPPHWATAVLVVSFAVCGWLNFDRLLEQATTPSPWAASARTVGLATAAGALAVLAPAGASKPLTSGSEVRPAPALPTKQAQHAGARRVHVA